MAPVERLITLSGGVEIACAEHGAADGTPVVFVHGYADSWRSFTEVLEELPDSVHAFALSLPGHGNSSVPASGYSTGELTNDIREFMDAVGITAAVLVGGSSGGFLARRFAVEHPTRTLGLVLLGSPFTLRDHPGVQQLWDATISKFEDPVPLDFIRDFQESSATRTLSPGLLDRLVAESAKLPARVWKDTLQGLLEDDSAGRLSEIQSPTLAVWGDRDSTVPRADQEKLVAAIPGARLLVYPGAGHAFYWEDPLRVARDIAEFVHGLPTRP